MILFIDEQETVPAVQAFAQKYNLAAPFLMDYSGEIGVQYQLFSTPTTYFIDAQGVIQDIQAGLVDLRWLEKNLSQSS